MKILLFLLIFGGCSVPEIILYQKIATWYSNTTNPTYGHVEPICKPQDLQHKEAVHCSEIEVTKCKGCCDVCGDYRIE